MSYLKRLQIITLTKPILALGTQVQTPQDLNRAQAAGIESIVEEEKAIKRILSS